MIYDKLENIKKYNLDLQFVLDTIHNKPFTKGKFDIAEPQYFGIGLEYQTQSAEKGLWEAHREYLDIHVILEGEEYIDISDISIMSPDTEYQHDYQLFKGEKEHTICLRKGYFLVLYPNEVHKTGIKIEESSSVKKLVFKLLIGE